jgi:hypothetical protein
VAQPTLSDSDMRYIRVRAGGDPVLLMMLSTRPRLLFERWLCLLNVPWSSFLGYKEQ